MASDAPAPARGLSRQPIGDRVFEHQAVGSPAEAYERFLVPAMFRASSVDLVGRADPRPGARLLDVACGTGVVARVAASAYATATTGVDKSRQFLREASSTCDGGAVRWVLGDGVALPFGRDSFDVAVCQQGLQFFDAPARGLKEIHRVLRAGGIAVVSSWASIERSPGFAALAAALAQHLGIEAGQLLWGGPWRLGDAAPIEQALRQTGFSTVQVDTQQVEAVFPSVWTFVAQYLACIGLQSIVFDPTGVFELLAADVEARSVPQGGTSEFAFFCESWVFTAGKAPRPATAFRTT